MSEINLEHVESVSLRGDVVCVRVRYDESDVSAEGYPSGPLIEIDHDEPLGNRFIVTVVPQAVEKALDKANAALAGWEKAVAA